MKKLVMFTTALFLFLLPSVYSITGIAVSPSKLDILFGDDSETSFPVKVINNGNTDLRIVISSEKFDIIPEKNHFIVQRCRCKNYCDIHLVECDTLSSPDEVMITLRNPKKPMVGNIKFTGTQLADGQEVSTNLGLNVTYKGQSMTEVESEALTTLPETTTTTTVPSGVVEPEDQQRKIYTPPETKKIGDKPELSFGEWIERNQTMFLLSIGGVGTVLVLSIFGYFIRKRKKTVEEIEKEMTRPQFPIYPTSQPIQMPYPQTEPIIIDEMKKKEEE